MSGLGYSIVGFFIAVSLLVTVHEFGHFFAAKKLGVKVLKFSIGFGKPIFYWRKDQDSTEYVISLIPLGGYVKMLDERTGNVLEVEKTKAFNQKSLFVRLAIVSAGPIFNFLFSILLIWLIFVFGMEGLKPIVGDVLSGSIAEKSGFYKGDQLIDVDGHQVKTWDQYQRYLLHRAMSGHVVNVKVVDEFGALREIELNFSDLNTYKMMNQSITSQIGMWPLPPPAVVQKIATHSPASKSGLISGDRIIRVNGKLIRDWFDLVSEISSRPGETIVLEINRGGAVLDITLLTNSVTIDGKKYGQIGLFRPKSQKALLQYGLLDAIWYSLEYNWQVTVITLRSLGKMITHQISSEHFSGPVTIARIAGHTMESGYGDFIKFLAILSISLGLLNFLPIPMLDGGQVLYLVIEALIRKPLSEKYLILGQKIGILIIAMMFGIAFYNDMVHL